MPLQNHEGEVAAKEGPIRPLLGYGVDGGCFGIEDLLSPSKKQTGRRIAFLVRYLH
jgi:hypothetical protein